MAYIRPHGNRLSIEIRHAGRRLTTTIALAPTKANIDAIHRQCKQVEDALADGQSWKDVKGWLRGEGPVTISKTLGYYAQHFFDTATVKDSTLKEYINTYNRYWLRFDNATVDDISRVEIEKHLQNFPTGAKTKKNAISLLSRILRIAIRNRDLSHNPVADWESNVRQKSKINPYTERERDALLAALPTDEARETFTFAFHTGLRTGELLALDWDDFTFPYAHIRRARVRGKITTTKTDQARDVALPPFLIARLREHPRRFAGGPVFRAPTGKPMLDGQWLRDQFEKAHDAAGVEMRTGPYPWRHTYISLALMAGATPFWVAKQAGHDEATMRAKYASWIRGKEEADMAELAKIYD